MFFEKDQVDPINPATALKKSATPELVEGLAKLLADVFTMYTHAQGFHWNVTGPNFTQLHDLFGDIYADVDGSIDPIAENIRKLGAYTPHTMGQFMRMTTVDDMPALDAASMVINLEKINSAVLATLNNVFAIATMANEQGIANFISERIDMHQKWGWQLRASAGR